MLCLIWKIGQALHKKKSIGLFDLILATIVQVHYLFPSQLNVSIFSWILDHACFNEGKIFERERIFVQIVYVIIVHPHHSKSMTFTNKSILKIVVKFPHLFLPC